MALLDAYEVQALGVGLGFSADDLQTFLDLEEAELTRRFGAPAAARSEVVRPRGQSLYLARPIGSVASISEQQYVGDPNPISRAAGDYVIWAGEGRLERAAGSLAWGVVCTVTYTPEDDTSLRTQVLLELARIATEQTTGMAGTTSGMGYSLTQIGTDGARNWQRARDLQYGRLGRWKS